MTTALANLVLESWADFDRAVDGLSARDAERGYGSSSPISWTVAHCSQMVDSWLNVSFQGVPADPLINGDYFKFKKGAAPDALDWTDIQRAVEKVRVVARSFLESTDEGSIDELVPYTGSIEPLRESGFSARYAMARIAAHHYFHLGEIVAIRNALGHDVGEYPGMLEACL